MVNGDANTAKMLNRALDHELSEEEQALLAAQTVAEPELAARLELLRKTDEVLRTTPMVAPSPQFVRRVMEAIATLPLPGLARRELSVGLVLGLLAAALLTIPMLALLFFLLLSVLTTPGAFNTLLQAGIDVFTYSLGLAADIAEQLRDWLRSSPGLAVLMVLVVPLAGLWAWLMWHLLSGRRMPVWRSRP